MSLDQVDRLVGFLTPMVYNITAHRARKSSTSNAWYSSRLLAKLHNVAVLLPAFSTILLPPMSTSHSLSQNSQILYKDELAHILGHTLSPLSHPWPVAKFRIEENSLCCVKSNPYLFFNVTRCLEYLSSGEKRAGCADFVTSLATTFFNV